MEEATREQRQGGDEESQLLPPATTSRPSSSRRRRLAASSPVPWPTIDGPLGLTVEESESHARRFYLWGWCLLPLLWGVNCFYFWPVLRSSRPFSSSHASSSPQAFDPIRKYVVRSAIAFVAATVLISSWTLTFMIGGRRLFGSAWDDLVVYNVAEKYGLTDWSGF